MRPHAIVLLHEIKIQIVLPALAVLFISSGGHQSRILGCRELILGKKILELIIRSITSSHFFLPKAIGDSS